MNSKILEKLWKDSHLIFISSSNTQWYTNTSFLPGYFTMIFIIRTAKTFIIKLRKKEFRLSWVLHVVNSPIPIIEFLVSSFFMEWKVPYSIFLIFSGHRYALYNWYLSFSMKIMIYPNFHFHNFLFFLYHTFSGLG